MEPDDDGPWRAAVTTIYFLLAAGQHSRWQFSSRLEGVTVAEPKTQRTKESVTAFIRRVADEGRRKDCTALVKILKQAAGAPPAMWGSSIIGFGSYTYKYASGRTGDWPIVGFAPRKQELTLYLSTGADGFGSLLTQLGKHKMSGSCLHIKRLSDVDPAVLTKLIAVSVRETRKKHS